MLKRFQDGFFLACKKGLICSPVLPCLHLAAHSRHPFPPPFFLTIRPFYYRGKGEWGEEEEGRSHAGKERGRKERRGRPSLPLPHLQKDGAGGQTDGVTERSPPLTSIPASLVQSQQHREFANAFVLYKIPKLTLCKALEDIGDALARAALKASPPAKYASSPLFPLFLTSFSTGSKAELRG